MSLRMYISAKLSRSVEIDERTTKYGQLELADIDVSISPKQSSQVHHGPKASRSSSLVVRPAEIRQMAPDVCSLHDLAGEERLSLVFGRRAISRGLYKKIYAGIWQGKPIVLKRYDAHHTLQHKTYFFYQHYQQLLPEMLRPIALWETERSNQMPRLWFAHWLMYSDMSYAASAWHQSSRSSTFAAREALTGVMVQGAGKQLDTLHYHDLGHGDVKLENMLLHPLGDTSPIVLDDFDFAKSKQAPLCQQGTLRMLAPELLQSIREGNPCTVDSWALACSAYSLLCNVDYWSVPFQPCVTEMLAALRTQHIHYMDQYKQSPELGPWTNVSGLTPDWQYWFANAMHPLPKHRWSIAEALATLPDIERSQAVKAQRFLRQQQHLQEKWLVGAAPITSLRSL